MACYPGGADDLEYNSTVTSVVVVPHYWRPFKGSSLLFDCGSGAACIGSLNGTANFGNGLCAKGHEGPLCSVCSDGYAPKGEPLECAQCEGGSAHATIAAYCSALLVALIVGFLISIRKSEPPPEAPEAMAKPDATRSMANAVASVIQYFDVIIAFFMDKMNKISEFMDQAMPFFKTAISYFQIVGGLSFAFEMKFPPVFNHTMAFMHGILSVNVISLMPLGCILPSNYHTSLVYYTICPLVFWVVAMLTCAIMDKAGKFQNLQNKIFSFVLLMSFLLLPILSVKIFNTFSCQEFDTGYGRYLKVDLSIDCDSPEHQRFQIFAAVMIVIYPIGVPAWYYSLLSKQHDKLDPGQKKLTISEGGEEEGLAEALRRRQVIEKSDPKVNRLKFLYKAYEPSCWWFEIFESKSKPAHHPHLI